MRNALRQSQELVMDSEEKLVKSKQTVENIVKNSPTFPRSKKSIVNKITEYFSDMNFFYDKELRRYIYIYIWTKFTF